MVVFHTAESAPDTASVCYGPASTTHKLLQWFDRIKYVDHLAAFTQSFLHGLCQPTVFSQSLFIQ